MANISKIDKTADKKKQQAARNRREIIAAGLSRREMLKMGLLTSAGVLVATRGLSARALNSAGHLDSGSGNPSSPPTTPFVQPFTRMTVKQPVASLTPTPTALPNIAAGEGRTVAHQAFTQFAPVKFYEIEQRLTNIITHPELPLQPLWGFDGLVPGPLYVERYGQPILVRNRNNLPLDNGGFGKNRVTTHLQYDSRLSNPDTD